MGITLPSDQDASGRSFDATELDLVAAVLASGTLTSTKGNQTKALETEFAQLMGSKHAIACASGSAAVHCAVAAFDSEPGDEFITTPITDMGALTPILYQGAIPVFADVDSISGNVTAETVAARISERTKAIIVTHLFGNPVEMDSVLALATQHGLPVIEDSAQSFLGASKGRPTGTMGSIGCFSFQQGKHITSGEGGILVTNDDALARRMRVFVNKAWPYGEANPDHEFIALNYRISELQSAVVRGQLTKLEAGVANRIAMAERLSKQIDGLPGIGTPIIADGDTHCFWRYALRVDGNVLLGGPDGLAAQLKSFEIPSAPRYIQKPAYKCKVIAEQRTFGNSRWPFTLARPEAVDYSDALFPGSLAMLEKVLVLSWSEKMSAEVVDHLASAIVVAVDALKAG